MADMCSFWLSFFSSSLMVKVAILRWHTSSVAR